MGTATWPVLDPRIAHRADAAARAWLRMMSGVWPFIAIAVLAITGWRMSTTGHPLGLTVRAEEGQLVITWNAAAHGARLEIADGADRVNVLVSAQLVGLTYIARTADVEVQLTGVGTRARKEFARFLIGQVALAEIQRQMAQLQADAHALRADVRRSTQHVSRLQEIADALMADIVIGPEKRAAGNTVWWR